MLFINPACEKYGGILNGVVPLLVPVGMGLVAGYLREHGVPVRLLDEELVDITPAVRFYIRVRTYCAYLRRTCVGCEDANWRWFFKSR